MSKDCCDAPPCASDHFLVFLFSVRPGSFRVRGHKDSSVPLRSLESIGWKALQGNIRVMPCPAGRPCEVPAIVYAPGLLLCHSPRSHRRAAMPTRLPNEPCSVPRRAKEGNLRQTERVCRETEIRLSLDLLKDETQAENVALKFTQTVQNYRKCLLIA